jgi:hypothetical protein
MATEPTMEEREERLRISIERLRQRLATPMTDKERVASVGAADELQRRMWEHLASQERAIRRVDVEDLLTGRRYSRSA